MANYTFLTTEEKLFIKVQTTCEHSCEYYVTTICRLRINLLGSHARFTIFGISTAGRYVTCFTRTQAQPHGRTIGLQDYT
jgi:hypothetical protein